jgi:anaerobic ribonucleoside-triphosphate reductase activating protein
MKIPYLLEDIRIGLIEIPSEISLLIPIVGCPFLCEGCHSSHYHNTNDTNLFDDIYNIIDKYIDKVSCIVLMGGTQYKELEELIYYIRAYCNKKIGLYSGEDIFPTYYTIVDYLKIGRYIQSRGGLDNVHTNQRMYAIGKNVLDITYKFRRFHDKNDDATGAEKN